MKNKRDATVDVARGLSVLFIPAIHSVLLYSTPSVQNGAIGTVLGFVAENFAAPVFLFLMGLSIPFARKKSSSQIVRRALGLLGCGYLLNVLKFVLPIYWDFIPQAFFLENGIPPGAEGLRQLLAMGDVLQSAAIGYLFCELFIKLARYWEWSVMLAIAVAIISPFCWDFHLLGDHLLPVSNLFNGRPPNTYFPIFPWLAYPLVGISAGHCLKHDRNSSFYRATIFVGLFCVLAGISLAQLEPITWENDFYRLGPSGTLYHTGMVFLWLFACYLLVRVFKWNILFSFFGWLSRNVTLFYMVQWIMIFWMLPFFCYRRRGIVSSWAAMLLTTILTTIVVYGISNVIQKRRLERKLHSNECIVN